MCRSRFRRGRKERSRDRKQPDLRHRAVGPAHDDVVVRRRGAASRDFSTGNGSGLRVGVAVVSALRCRRGAILRRRTGTSAAELRAVSATTDRRRARHLASSIAFSVKDRSYLAISTHLTSSDRVTADLVVSSEPWTQPHRRAHGRSHRPGHGAKVHCLSLPSWAGYYYMSQLARRKQVGQQFVE